MKATTKIKIQPSLPEDQIARVAWLEAHGPVCGVTEVEVTADLRTWIAAGTTVDDQGAVSVGRYGGLSYRSPYKPIDLEIALRDLAEAAYLEAGSIVPLGDADVRAAGEAVRADVARVAAESAATLAAERTKTIDRCTVVQLAEVLRKRPGCSAVYVGSDDLLWVATVGTETGRVPLADLPAQLVTDARALAVLLSAEYARGLEDGEEAAAAAALAEHEEATADDE